MSITAGASERIGANQLEVAIVADDGRTFARYDLADGIPGDVLRAYLEAERGRNYAIRVRNKTGRRIGLVIAVDGRNIISGAKSQLGAGEPMYVLGAHDQATYHGWRTSDTRVQRFFFTAAEQSYAEAWGDSSAMGVIAVAAFRELAPVHIQRRLQGPEMVPHREAPSDPSASKSMESADAAGAAGTGFGASHGSPSVRVHFKAQRHAFSKQFFKYEWRETLVRLGVIRPPAPLNRFWPEHIGQVQGFAPYPPGYWNAYR